MTENDYLLLSKFKNKRAINNRDIINIEHLQKIKLIAIDNLYMNTIEGVVIYYAQTTNLGIQLLNQYNKKHKFSLFRKFFK